MKTRKETAKQIEIAIYRRDFAGKNYSELNIEALKMANEAMQSKPNTWKVALRSNRRYLAIMELMKEIQG